MARKKRVYLVVGRWKHAYGEYIRTRIYVSRAGAEFRKKRWLKGGKPEFDHYGYELTSGFKPAEEVVIIPSEPIQFDADQVEISPALGVLLTDHYR